MYKKVLILIGIIVLTINTAIWAVTFSSTTKSNYQTRLNNLLNKASTYTYISAAEKNTYQKCMNESLNAIEFLLNDPNVPESEKVKIINDFDNSISSMEKSINNLNIPATQKIAGIKTVLQNMQTTVAQNAKIQQIESANNNKYAEEQAKRKAEDAKWEAQQAALQKKEAEQKAQAEKIRLEDEKDLKMLQQGTKVIREYAHFYEFKVKYAGSNSGEKTDMTKVYDTFCRSKGEKLPSRREIANLISTFYNININPDAEFKYYLNYIHPDRKYIALVADNNRVKHFADLRENGALTDMYIRSKDVINGKNLGVRLHSLGYKPVTFPIEQDPFLEAHAASMYIMCISKNID